METILKSRIILSRIADFFSSACCSKNRPNLNLYFVKMCHQVTCIQWLWLHLSVVSLNGQRHLYWIISGWLIYTIDILHLCTYFHIINVKNKSAIVILTLCAFSWYTARTCSSKLKSRVAYLPSLMFIMIMWQRKWWDFRATTYRKYILLCVQYVRVA